jgi:hypothetical protein
MGETENGARIHFVHPITVSPILRFFLILSPWALKKNPG